MGWRRITHDGVAAAEGLATDEVLARRAGTGQAPPMLRLYSYRAHSALVGRFQDVAHEIHTERCALEGIEINRRPTGGGAILMGPDQLGIALATGGDERERRAGARRLMARFSQGVVAGLDALGIAARFRGKNDVEVGGRKIAGLGIHRVADGGLLFHASLLVGLDVRLMARVLRTPFARLGDVEIETVAARTTTVREHLGDETTLDHVRECVADGFARAYDVELEPHELTPDERREADDLARDKYLTDKWIFQTTAVEDAAGTAALHMPGGRLDVGLALAGGTIKALHVRGDFFADDAAVADLEGRLRWHPAERAAVANTVADWAARHNYDTLAPDALVRAIVTAARNAQPLEPYGCFVSPGGVRG